MHETGHQKKVNMNVKKTNNGCSTSAHAYLFSPQVSAPNTDKLIFKIRLMLNIFNSLYKHKCKETTQNTFRLYCIIPAGLG